MISAVIMAMSGEKFWEQGVFRCFDNPQICCLALFCPCYIAGKKAEALGESCLVCGAMSLLEPCRFASAVALRMRLRERRNILGNLTSDMKCIYCCGPCALSQEYVEIQAMQKAEAPPTNGHTLTRI